MTCIQCGQPFAANHQLATVPEGAQIAFDAERRRVWRICGCGEWNLMHPERSGLAVTELLTRFEAGSVRYFETLALSRIGPALELTRITGSRNTLVADGTAPPRWRRDDAAAEVRQEQIGKHSRFMTGIFVVNILLFGAMAGVRAVEALVSGDPARIASLALALAVWITVLYLLRRVLAPVLTKRALARGNVPPEMIVDYPLFAAPKGQSRHVRTMHHFATLSFLFTAILVIRLGAPPNWKILGQTGLTMLFVMPLAVLVLTALGGGRRTRLGKRVMLGSAAVSAVAAVAIAATPLVRREVLAVLTATTLIPVLLIDGMRRLRARRSGGGVAEIRYRGPDGAWIAEAPSNGFALTFDWTDQGHLTAYDLPGADAVGDPEASQVIRAVLHQYHFALPPSANETRDAAELLRSVGGGRGLLNALEGFRRAQDGRIAPIHLPMIYRVALDLALAVPYQVPREALERELAAEHASDIAGEAEALDRLI